MEIPVHVHQAGAKPIGCDMSWESSYYWKCLLFYVPGMSSFNVTNIIPFDQKMVPKILEMVQNMVSFLVTLLQFGAAIFRQKAK